MLSNVLMCNYRNQLANNSTHNYALLKKLIIIPTIIVKGILLLIKDNNNKLSTIIISFYGINLNYKCFSILNKIIFYRELLFIIKLLTS